MKLAYTQAIFSSFFPSSSLSFKRNLFHCYKTFMFSALFSVFNYSFSFRFQFFSLCQFFFSFTLSPLVLVWCLCDNVIFIAQCYNVYKQLYMDLCLCGASAQITYGKFNFSFILCITSFLVVYSIQIGIITIGIVILASIIKFIYLQKCAALLNFLCVRALAMVFSLILYVMCLCIVWAHKKQILSVLLSLLPSIFLWHLQIKPIFT